MGTALHEAGVLTFIHLAVLLCVAAVTCLYKLGTASQRRGNIPLQHVTTYNQGLILLAKVKYSSLARHTASLHLVSCVGDRQMPGTGSHKGSDSPSPHSQPTARRR